MGATWKKIMYKFNRLKYYNCEHKNNNNIIIMINFVPSQVCFFISIHCVLIYIKMERSRLKRNAYMKPAPLFGFTTHNKKWWMKKKYMKKNLYIHLYKYILMIHKIHWYIHTNRIYLYIPFHRKDTIYYLYWIIPNQINYAASPPSDIIKKVFIHIAYIL